MPSETPAPNGAAITVNGRPMANGDSFTYAGSTTQTFVYMGTSPSPSASTSSTVRQTITVATNKTYNGASNLDEFTTSETDTSPNQTSTITTNAYEALTAGPTNSSTGVTQQALTSYGYTSSDSFGQTLAVTLANPGYANNSGTVDLLPEMRTPTWTNGLAQTIVQNESDGFSATRTYAADGSYTENDTYPQNSAASPQPTPLTAAIIEKSDGSGSYSLPLFGPPNTTIDFSAPTSNGQITLTFPETSVSAMFVSAWFAQPIKLYSEVDRNNGQVSIPSSCNASTSYGSSVNEVEQKYTRTDTILGTLEFFDQLEYVSPTAGAICVMLSDTTYVYYDYSGQTNSDVGPGFNGGNSPLETQTVSTTFALQTGAVTNARTRDGASVAAAGAYAVANARANFLSTVDRYNAVRRERMLQHFRTVLTRLHR